MADEVDRQLERDTVLDEANLTLVRERASRIPVGAPGDCDMCGEWSGRLVQGVCAPCRDLHRLP